MTNRQPLGAGGDGPASSPWTSLPISVYNLLGSEMDANGLHAMRLVCSKWCKNVEQHVSLNAKVDDSVQGNLEFVKRVKVVNARILNWTVTDIGTEPANLLFQYPDRLKRLDLCGKMPAQWKIHNLREFPSLVHLVLRNRALSSNNLTGHQYPIHMFDPTSSLSLEDALIQAYETQVPPTEAQPIELKSLQTLEIAINDFYSNPTTAQLPKHSYLVMKANLSFICSHIKSPMLSVVHLDMIGSMAALHTFLDNHCTSLRHLFLPSLSSGLLIAHEDPIFQSSNSLLINLRKLRLDVKGPYRDPYTRGEPDQSTFSYLQNFLAAQTHLEDVYFHFASFPVKWISDALTSLSNSCARTLRYLELVACPNQRIGVLDLEMLSICQRLEVLYMPWWGRSSMTYRNVEKLPTSLKRLVIYEGEGGGIEIGDPNVFKRLVALEWLSLFDIHFQIASKSGNQGPERQFFRSMIKGLLGLRKLQGFHLKFQGIWLNHDPNVVKMLNPLGQNINPSQRHPHSSIEFNLKWQWCDRGSPPWSDRPFDKKTLDIEKDPQQSAVLMSENEAGENINEGDKTLEDEQHEYVDDSDEENEENEEDKNKDSSDEEDEDVNWTDEDDL